MNAVRLRSTACLSLLAVLGGCADAPARASSGSSGAETVDGVEVVWSEGPGVWGAEAVEARHTLTIGELEGEPEYLFGMITSIAVDTAGRIYVADGMGSHVRVYDPGGRYLATIGRQGRGPGEFEMPQGIAFAPDGSASCG